MVSETPKTGYTDGSSVAKEEDGEGTRSIIRDHRLLRRRSRRVEDWGPSFFSRSFFREKEESRKLDFAFLCISFARFYPFCEEILERLYGMENFFTPPRFLIVCANCSEALFHDICSLFFVESCLQFFLASFQDFSSSGIWFHTIFLA